MNKIEYSQEKKDLITSSSIDELMQLLNEISQSKERSFLNKEVLSKFVVPTLKNSKTDSIKYGKETKENYCKALRGELKGFFANKQHTKKTTPQEAAFQLFDLVVKLWCSSNAEINELDLEENKTEFQGIMDAALKSNVSKETLNTLYKFSPLPIDKKLEAKINKAPNRMAIFNKLSEKNIIESSKEITNLQNQLKKQSGELNILKSKCEELEEEVEQHSDYYEIKKQLEEKTTECNKYSDYEQIKEKADTISLIQNNYNELLTKYKNIIQENTELKNKNQTSPDIEKMKEGFKKQIKEKMDIISEKEETISELNKKISDYDEIISHDIDKLATENNVLKRREVQDLRAIKSKIESDDEFRQKFKRLILSDKPTCDLIIRKLNLKQEVVLEASARIAQQEIENKQMSHSEPVQEKSINKKLISFEESENLFTYPNKSLLSDSNQEEFKEELFSRLDGDEQYKEDLYNKMQKSFVILNKKEELNAWLRAQDYDLKPIIVIPEFDWTSYKDWFGDFKGSRFIPASTLVPNFYKFIKNNPNIPLGIIEFIDFNKILPDLYIEPFIQNIEYNRGLYLTNPSKKINNADIDYRFVKALPNLKFVFIKSQAPKAFEIPQFMKKYEVISE